MIDIPNRRPNNAYANDTLKYRIANKLRANGIEDNTLSIFDMLDFFPHLLHSIKGLILKKRFLKDIVSRLQCGHLYFFILTPDEADFASFFHDLL